MMNALKIRALALAISTVALVETEASAAEPHPCNVLEPGLTSRLEPELRVEILKRYNATYDRTHGGWSTTMKTVEPAEIELAMIAGQRGDDQCAAMAQRTLLSHLSLVDPVWGGAFDYSLASGKNPWRTPVIRSRPQPKRTACGCTSWLPRAGAPAST